MDNTREKVLDLLCQGRDMANELCGKQEGCEKCPYQAPKGCAFGVIADHIIANGVTFTKDINVLTNADRIRAMSDEELKKFLCDNTKCEVCKYELWGGCDLRNWLQRSAEVDNG